MSWQGIKNTASGLLGIDSNGKVSASDGSQLTSLNGSSIASGTISNSFLPTATGAALGIIKPDTNSFNITTGTLSIKNGVYNTVWTPTDGSGASLVLLINNANYSRLVNVVFLALDIVYPSTASGANAKLASLPLFTAVPTVVFVENTAGLPISGFVNGNTLSFHNSTTGVPITNIQLSTAELYISGMYFV